MLTEKEKQEYKRNLADAETAYSLAKKVFEYCDHHAVKKEVHEAMFGLNWAVVMLKKALED